MTVETINDLRLTPGTSQYEKCSLLGYYNPGDGGGGEFYWDNTSMAADNNGTIIKVTGYTGSWLRLYDRAVSPKWFGAKGDGVSNDSIPLSYCANNFPEVDLQHENYKVSDMSWASDAILKNGTISTFALTRISVFANLTLEHVVFDAVDQTVRTALLYAFSGSITAYYCTFKNIKTLTPPETPTNATRNQYAIIAEMANCNVRLDNVIFENISNMGDADGSEEESGFCGGIFMLGATDITYDNPSLPSYYKTVYSHPSRVNIINCTFNNIYTIKHPLNPQPLDSDADAVRISINGYDDRFDIVHNILLEGNRFIDIQKSCVKAGNFNGLIISNSEIINNISSPRPLLGAFRLQPLRGAVIDNVLYSGSCTYLMYMRECEDVIFKNIIVQGNSNVITAFQIIEKNKNIRINDSLVNCSRFLNTEIISSATACKSLEITNCKVTQLSAESPFVRIQKSSDVCIANCSFTTLDVATVDCINISDTPGFTLSGSDLFYGRTAIACTENNLSVPNNIFIRNCRFERKQISTGSRHILLRATSGTNQQLRGVEIRNCHFNTYNQPSRTNDEIMLITAIDLVLSDLSLNVRKILTNMVQPSVGLIQILQSSHVSIQDIRAFHDFIPNGEAFIVLVRDTTNISVFDIKSYNADAVTLYTGTDFISVVNIFCKTSRIDLQGELVPVNRYVANKSAIL